MIDSVVTWGGIAVAVGVLVKVILIVWKLADRINKTDGRAESASLSAAAAHAEMDILRDAFVEHRVAVAANYVSREMLTSEVNRVLGAIDKLGERIDRYATPH